MSSQADTEQRIQKLETRFRYLMVVTISLAGVVFLFSLNALNHNAAVAPTRRSLAARDRVREEDPIGTTQPPSEVTPQPKCIGVIGLEDEFAIGGALGWRYSGSADRAGMYPFADVFAKVGDVLVFRGPENYYKDPKLIAKISDTVVLFLNNEAFADCNFSTPHSKLLAVREDLRRPGGYKWKIPPQAKGLTLLFASGLRNSRGYWACQRGIKVRVHVSPRLEIPIRYVNDSGNNGDAADSKSVLRLRNAVSKLSRLAVLIQLQLEQRIRSEGHSGLTDIRGFGQGNEAYNDGHFSRGAIASIHNHANNIRTVGMGEIQAVLNGVEFQTRHNDYTLRQPSTTSKAYHATENIEFPDVPPEVLNQSSVAGQIEEMQKWFKAFKEQDLSVRDYRKYFKPILCYLEGTWIEETVNLEDPFLSDRHKIDAATWRELHAKVRYLSNSGRKNLAENIAFLPNAVRDIVNDTYPVLSNWEYRIMCIPLKSDVPLQRFRVASDLSTQLHSRPATRKELFGSRKARFELNVRVGRNGVPEENLWKGKQQRKIAWDTTPRSYDYYDYLMEQIPGKNNYGSTLNDTLADGEYPAYHFFPSRGVLNAAFYSRYYSVPEKDAMGVARHRRGYHDAYLWAARTTQKRVSQVSYTEKRGRTVKSASARWSYAIPLEIIYLTPLSKWNPYNITEKAKMSDVTKGGRNGACDEDGSKAYDGWYRRLAYFTPAGLFGSGTETGEGDTTGSSAVCVLDSNGVMRRTRSSGHWIVFPSMNGVGQVRQRYPMMPIHESGSTSWKELKALQKLVVNENYESDAKGFFGDDRDAIYGFSVDLIGGGHQHSVYLSAKTLRGWKMRDGSFDTNGTLIITAKSSLANAHEHRIQVTRTFDDNQNEWKYRLVACKFASGGNYQNGRCADGHDAIERIF